MPAVGLDVRAGRHLCPRVALLVLERCAIALRPAVGHLHEDTAGVVGDVDELTGRLGRVGHHLHGLDRVAVHLAAVVQPVGGTEQLDVERRVRAVRAQHVAVVQERAVGADAHALKAGEHVTGLHPGLVGGEPAATEETQMPRPWPSSENTPWPLIPRLSTSSPAIRSSITSKHLVAVDGEVRVDRVVAA